MFMSASNSTVNNDNDVRLYIRELGFRRVLKAGSGKNNSKSAGRMFYTPTLNFEAKD